MVSGGGETLRLRSLLLIWSLLTLASQGLAQGCEGWNTSLFFLAATPAEVRACLAAGAEVNIRAAVLGHTPLHLAARGSNNPAVIEVLLEAGAAATARDLRGNTPWDYAREREELKGSDAYSRLSEAQAVAADCSGWNRREFFRSATLELVADCLTAGTEVNARDRRDSTPLHYTAELSDNPAVITALLAAGAEVNARDLGGWAPLDYAALLTANPIISSTLLEAGAEVNARNESGSTPLHYAALLTGGPAVTRAAVITTLLDAGADAAAEDAEGLTPWAYAQINEGLEGIDAYWRLYEGSLE